MFLEALIFLWLPVFLVIAAPVIHLWMLHKHEAARKWPIVLFGVSSLMVWAQNIPGEGILTGLVALTVVSSLAVLLVTALTQRLPKSEKQSLLTPIAVILILSIFFFAHGIIAWRISSSI